MILLPHINHTDHQRSDAQADAEQRVEYMKDDVIGRVLINGLGEERYQRLRREQPDLVAMLPPCRSILEPSGAGARATWWRRFLSLHIRPDYKAECCFNTLIMRQPVEKVAGQEYHERWPSVRGTGGQP
jgi:hypothetical protein